MPYQESLFGGARPRRPPAQLEDIFSARRAAELQDRSPAELAGLIRRRTTRLVLALALYDKAIAERKKALLNKEHDVVNGASLVLSTLTNGYFSPLMAEQRFDVLIVEEASMAVLPALFYAACLGRRKTVMVGDPCQLPSIVQSNEDYVRKVMGRNIFEVAVAEPLSSPLVAMLDVQYRMHPLIGELVSDLFYAGRLKHGGDPAMRERIAAREPMPDRRWSCWIPPAARRASQAPGANPGSTSPRPICVSTSPYARCVRVRSRWRSSRRMSIRPARSGRVSRTRLAIKERGDRSSAAPSTASRDRSGMSSSWTPLTRSR